MNMGPWQIRRYNDFAKGEPLPLGTRVYLQPKRGKAAKTKVHVVQNGETLHDISQQYGVKLKRLIKRSEFQAGYEVKPGDKVVLR
jgi:LysM repeat protein